MAINSKSKTELQLSLIVQTEENLRTQETCYFLKSTDSYFCNTKETIGYSMLLKMLSFSYYSHTDFS